MSYKEMMFTDCLRILAAEEEQAVRRQLSLSWKPIGEFVNEIVTRLDRQLDTDWITEYLSWHSKPEES